MRNRRKSRKILNVERYFRKCVTHIFKITRNVDIFTVNNIFQMLTVNN
jgi:hypothetical protein